MATKNDITGDFIQSRGVTDEYRNNYDLVFGKKIKEQKLNNDDFAEYELNKSTGEVQKVDNTGATVNDYQDILSTEDSIIDE